MVRTMGDCMAVKFSSLSNLNFFKTAMIVINNDTLCVFHGMVSRFLVSRFHAHVECLALSLLGS